MRQKNYRGKRLLAGLMLFVMVSSVVADCNVATAFAADNKLNISDQNNITQNLENSNITDESNASEEKNISNEAPALKEDYQEDSLTETTPELTPNPEKIPEITKENKETEAKTDSEEAKDEDSELDPSEESEEDKGFNKESIVDSYKVVIKADEGVFPDGTKVDIKTVDTIGDEDATDIISEEVEELEPNAEIVKTITFDITFYSKEGKVIEPENGSVSITITPDIQETSELQEIEKELGTALECSVFHVDEELNVEEVECEVKEDFTEVSFDAESFSTYTVIWYASPDAEGNQETSLEGPKYIDGFEKVPFSFSEFNIPIAWTNDDGDNVLRPTTLEFSVYGKDTNATGSGNRVKICDVKVKLTEDSEKKASNITINLADDVKIPVYVKKGTGEIKSGGNGHYEMDGFKYEVKFHDENTAYTAKYNPSTSAYSQVEIKQEDNEAIWYANAGKITNERKDLADASFKIEWYDNHNENGKRPTTEALKGNVKLYYCTTTDSTLKPVTSDMMPAGVAKTGPNISEDSYSTWSISYKNLIPEDENGKKITYKLKIDDNFAGNNYTTDNTADSNGFINEGGKRNYYLLGNFEAEIRWNDGGRDNELRPEIADKIKVFKIEEGAGGPVEVNIPISSEEDIEINKTGNANTWNLVIKNLVMYSNEGDGVVSYYVKLDAMTLVDKTDHIYGISYTNAPKSTDVLKCHNEGKIYLTLKSNLNNFTIHKEWLDGEDGNTTNDGRKDFIKQGIKLYLWRYPVKKVVGEKVVMGTIEDGAPVNDANNGEQYYCTLDKDIHSKNFDLHLTDFVTDGSKLDMYDTQGYEYVYYVTEIMTGNEYVTSYSNVNPYTHIVTAVADGGTLTNLRKESVKIEGIVRWRVPSVTDYTKAAATICLQRFDADSNKWVNVGSPVIVTGFTEADPQRKHVFPAVDKFDDKGHEITYRVIETNINYNGSDISVENYNPSLESEDKRYVADDYKMNDFDYTATAHPTYSTPSTEAEKYSFTVDNRMSGDVKLDITKVWASKAEYEGGDNDPGNYSDISITIYQKDYSGHEEPFGTVNVTLDETDGKKTGHIAGGNSATFTKNSGGSESVPIDVSVSEGNLVWSFKEIEVPEFNSDGRAYTYSVRETNIAGDSGIPNTHTDYEYEFIGKDIYTTVKNTFVPSGGGSSFYFEIDKEWIDGADLSQRQPVTVAIVSVDESGNYKYEDNEGKTHEYVLSAKNNWHEDVWIDKTYKDDSVDKPRFNQKNGQYLWTVIEKDVSLKAEYEKFEGLDLTAADDKMDEIHREVKYTSTTLDLSANSISGKVDAIAHNDINRPGYEVTIKAVGGGSVIGASKYEVTNKRAGEVNVEFDKKWHDSENKTNTRGDALRVYLYQNGKKVVKGDESQTTDQDAYISSINTYIDNSAYDKTNPAEIKYTFDKVNGSGNSNKIEFKNLPKYDEYGVEYEYSVREFMVRGAEEIEILTHDTEDTTLSGYVADIEGHGESVTFEKNNEKLIRNELYTYNNTLTGKMTTGVPFYVLWHDQSSYENGGRPDMYFTLYYRPIGATDGELKKFEGDYKVIWEAITEENGRTNPYYKKATFIGLPAADEKGNAYEFFASASLNNAADHYYENYFNTHEDAIVLDGTGDKALVYADEDEDETNRIHHYDIKDAPYNNVKTITVNGAEVKLIPADGLVEYIIHEEIRPTGKKYWKNVPQGITATDLPNVDIYLGRYSDHDKDKQMYSDDNPTTVVFGNKKAITSLDGDKLSFNFETTKEGDTAPYEKYDSYGQIYTYQLAEKIYVNSENATGYEVPNYIMRYDPDSLNLVNTYLNGETTHVSSRKITVNKVWKDKNGDLSLTGKYPVARFKLYRMEIDPKDCVSPDNSTDIPYNPTIAKYSDVVSNFNTYKNDGTFKECDEELKIQYGVGSQSPSWDDMPIYAPSGRPYLYVVEEISDHGMSAYKIDNDATTEPATTNRKISQTQVLISNYGLNPQKTYNDTENQKSERFTNTLKNDETFNKIIGGKLWTDNALFTDVRPNPTNCNTGASNQQIKLVVKRTARAQTGVGVNNAITNDILEEGTHYNVTWSETGNTWTYVIEPINGFEFQVYAPNGQPYTYTVTEDLQDVADENYKATVPSVAKITINNNGTSNIEVEADGTTKYLKETTSLSNTLKGQVQLFKKWDDALNELKLRSGFVHVILQYREVPKKDSEGTITYSEGANTSIGWTTYKKDSTDGIYELSYLLNKWKTNITNLPIKSSDGNNVYEYRVLEVNFNDHEAAPIYPISYDEEHDTVSYKPDKNVEATASVPNGGDGYKNSNRYPGHFETQADNYIITHSLIANLIDENTRKLQVENFLSEKAALVIEKKWDGIEGADNYKVLPDNIVFKIQYSTDPDNANSWKDLIGEGGSVVTATVSKDDDWKQAVDSQLPLSTGGKLTYYRAIELATNLGRFEGYTGEGRVMSEKPANPGVEYGYYKKYDDTNHRVECSTTATNTLATRDLTVKKKWNDDKDAVHSNVVIELWSYNYKTGSDGSGTFELVPGTNVTLEKSKGYEFTYHNLPLKNKNGNPVVYYVKEVNVDGAAYNSTKYNTAFFVSTDGSSYSQVKANSNASNIAAIDKSGTAKSVCIVNTPKTTLNVTKKWNDEKNRHQFRKGVVFRLTYNDGKLWSSITTNTDDNKKYSFTKLPIYNVPDAAFVTSTDYNMGKVKYTVTEDNINVKSYGYKDPVYTVNGVLATTGTLELVPSTTANNVIVLNELNPPKATITADKLWDDENNRHGSRASQVELSLYYRVGTAGNWNLITKKPLDGDGNYSDGGVYTTSEVTQALSRDEVSSTDSNIWSHDGHSSKFTTWENLPTVQDKKTIYYKVLETSGNAKATVPANYTGDFSGYEVSYSVPGGTAFTQDKESINQVVTNKLKRTEILVEKDWGDTAEQKIRPYSVTFELEYKHANMPWRQYKEENGDVKQVVVTGDHDSKTWTKIVTDLPFADCEGHKYEYRFKEVSIEISGKEIVKDLEDDDSSFSDTTWKGELGTYKDEVTISPSTGTSYNYKVTATNTPEVGSITVTKVWDDDNNRDGLRPNTIDVTLYRDGKVYDKKAIGLKENGTPLTGTTVNPSNSNEWTYTWTNLPMYKDNAGVHDKERMSSHYVVEEPISDDIVLNYKQATYGNFRESITNPIASHVQSRVSGEDDRDTDLWIKNTHEPIRFKIDAYKKWDDLKNSQKYRPGSIGMELQYYDSTETVEENRWKKVEVISVGDLDKTGEKVQTTSTNPQTISAIDDENVEGHYPDVWKTPAVWENLPAYRIVNGKTETIEYRVYEIFTETHYEAERPHFSYDIEEAKKDKTYPSDPLYVENIADYNSTLTVVKEWSNKELLEKYGALPSELHVMLQKWGYSDVENKDTWLDYDGGEAVLSEHEASENSWTHTYQGLNAIDQYRVVEKYIKFENGKIIKSSGITDASDDSGDGNGNGRIGNFNIGVESHFKIAASSKHWEVKLTNSLPNRSLEVTKKWNDENDRDELRPTHIYVTLFRDGEKLETKILEEANSWKYKWNYLPLYKNETKEDGTPILSKYSLIETDIHGEPVSLNGYDVSYAIKKPDPAPKIPLTNDFDLNEIEDGQQVEITITNTHEPAKATVHAGKKWDDYSNKYGERATTVYLALFYKYQHEADNNDNWRLVGKVNEADLDANGLYRDSLIHTTSDPVQELSGSGDYWNWKKDVNVNWENLPSQAVVGGVIRIPEYRVIEVKPEHKTITAETKLSAVLGSDDTSVIRGYKTTQPEAFFVHDGVDNISFVNGGNDNEDKNIIVVNKLETVNALIIKEWNDQNNRFANRPDRIDFAIQKKQKNVSGSSWEPLKQNNNPIIVSVYPNMLGDNEDTWKLSVDEVADVGRLPKCDVHGEELIYRAVEISLVYGGKPPVSVYVDSNWFADTLPVIGIGNGHGYKTEETVTGIEVNGEYRTTITNTQDKSAKVTAIKKEWNDYNNGRNTRPLSVVFEVEKKPVHEKTVLGIIAEIGDFFKENGGWTPVYETNGAGEKVVATITLDGPDFGGEDGESLKGLPLYDENGKELVYRAREKQLVYENRTVDIASGASPYLAPKYEDDAKILTPAVEGITHSYTTKATNTIKPDPPKPPEDDPKPEDDPETPPVVPPVIPPKDPDKPELPPELEDIDEKIDEIEEPEDLIPIVDELIDLPDSPERDYVVKKLWVVVSTMANDPTFYDHFDPEMQDILKRFVKSGVLGRRRGLPKTGGLKGSFLIMLMGFALIGIGNGFINDKKRKKR